MKNALLFLLLVAMASCKSFEYRTIEDQSYKIFRPPGTIKVDDQLYADETELTNLDYKEYLNWNERIFGKDSKEYTEKIPDESVWAQLSNYTAVKENYFQDQKFDHYPVVGITLEQAQKYTAWRTDRVAEMILLMEKAIKADYQYSKEDYFTVDRYQQGGYAWMAAKKNVLLPKYKVPTKQEWEFIAGIHSDFKNGIDVNSKHNKKMTAASASANNKEGSTYPVRTYETNIYGLYGVMGNVSELVVDGDICKGGSWANADRTFALDLDIPLAGAASWAGFRNVAQLELVRVN